MVENPQFVWVGGNCFNDDNNQANGGLFNCNYNNSRNYDNNTGFRPSPTATLHIDRRRPA